MSVSPWVLDVGLVMLGCLAFAPGMPATLLRYDDSIYLSQNTQLLSRPGWAGLVGMWDGGRAWRGEFVEFFPLRDSVYWAIYQAWQLEGLPYHLASLFFHLVTSLLLVRLGAALGLSAWAAGATALLFAVHPIHIESIAWAAGLKDPMYTAGLAGCLLAYARYRLEPRPSLYALALLLFVASLLVKSMALSTLLLLLAVERLVGNPTPWKRIVLRLWGFAAISGLFLVQFILIGKASKVVLGPHGGTWASHVVLTAWAQAKYLKQALVPSSFQLIYCFTPPGGLLDWRLLVALVALGGVGALLFFARRQRLMVLAGAWYFACLLPVSNLVPFPAVMADRYLYAAVFGPCLAAAMLLERLVNLRNFVTGSIVVTFALTCASRSALWNNEENLWIDTDEDPECMTDQSRPATDAHLLRYHSARDPQVKLEAIERALATKGVTQGTHLCEALQNAALLNAKGGQLERGERWALLATQRCRDDAASWSALAATTQHRKPAVALDAAQKVYRMSPSNPRRALVGLMQMETGNLEGNQAVLAAARLEPQRVCPLVQRWAADVPTLVPSLAEVLPLCRPGATP